MAAIMSKQNNVILATGTAAARCTGVENYPQVIYTIGLMGGHMGKQGNAVFYNLTAMNYVTKAYTGARGRAAFDSEPPEVRGRARSQSRGHPLGWAQLDRCAAALAQHA